jgi:hypothetical protein
VRQVLLEGRALHIFPCRADKKPACDHGFDDAVADQAGIDRLWSAVWPRNRPALVGVATGVISGISVIDIDSRRGGDRWFFENRDRLPKTRTHESQSGDQHLIYRNLPGLRSSKDLIAPGVEIKADGTYVIWWAVNGCRVLCEGPVAEFPKWFADELVTRVISTASNGRGDATFIAGAETTKSLPRNLYFQVLKLVPLSTSITRRTQRRVCGWLSGVVHATEGSRNDWVFWAACRFSEFVTEGRLRPEIAEQLLFAAATDLVEDDGAQSVRATIASGLRTGSAINVASPHFSGDAA